MKLLICLVIGLTICQVEQITANLGPEDTCVKDYNLREYYLKGTSVVSNTSLDDAEAGQFYTCAWTARGIMHDDNIVSQKAEDFFQNEFFKHSQLSQVEKEGYMNQLKIQCFNIKEATKERTAIKFKNCFVKIFKEADVMKG